MTACIKLRNVFLIINQFANPFLYKILFASYQKLIEAIRSERVPFLTPKSEKQPLFHEIKYFTQILTAYQGEAGHLGQNLLAINKIDSNRFLDNNASQ